MPDKRVINNGVLVGHDAQQLEHNQTSGSKKVLPQAGYPVYIGDGSAVRYVTRGGYVMLWNLTGTIGYVKLSDATATGAPAAPGAKIIPVPPNNFITICMGPNASILGSASTIHIYEIMDQSSLQVDNS